MKRAATDPASQAQPRRTLLWLGLWLCAADLGCARLRPSTRVGEPTPPLLGVRSPSGGYPAGKDLALADGEARDRRGRAGGVSYRTTALPAVAEVTAEAGGEDGPARVALDPPTPAPDQDPGPTPREERPSRKAGAAEDPTATIAELVAAAHGKLRAAASYQVRMERQERVGQTLLPAEEVVLSIRREPKAVRLEWPTGPHKGREVIYEAGAGGGLMQIHAPNSLVPRLSLSPDSPLVLKSSRHPITEAGFETLVGQLERWVALRKAGDASAGELSYGGLEPPDSRSAPCHKVIRVTPDRATEVVYFDPETKLPALFQSTAANGDLLERYRFLDPAFDVAELAEAKAFDPDSRWGASRGLLGRLAGPADGPDRRSTR